MKGILLDSQGDLLVDVVGDIGIGDDMAQLAECVLRANLGDLKETPLVGAGVVNMQNGLPDKMWCSQTKQMLRASGVPVQNVTMTDDGLILLT